MIFDHTLHHTHEMNVFIPAGESGLGLGLGLNPDQGALKLFWWVVVVHPFLAYVGFSFNLLLIINKLCTNKVPEPLHYGLLRIAE